MKKKWPMSISACDRGTHDTALQTRGNRDCGNPVDSAGNQREWGQMLQEYRGVEK